MEYILETQGERLKQLRHNLNLTQTELGAKLNMSKQYFSKAETNTIVLNNKQLVALCVDYDVNISWLLCGKGTMFNEPPENSATQTKQDKKELAELIKETLIEMILEKGGQELLNKLLK